MALTKKQKVLVAVLGVGLGALVLDRTLLRPQGGPRGASAETADGDRTTGSPRDNLPAEEPEKAGVAQRLNELWPSRELNIAGARDPFSLPASWADGDDEGARRPKAAAEFLNVHRLTAVVIDGHRSRAFIDDHFASIGDEIDGFELVEVEARSAVFERDGTQVTLWLLDR